MEDILPSQKQKARFFCFSILTPALRSRTAGPGRMGCQQREHHDTDDKGSGLENGQLRSISSCYPNYNVSRARMSHVKTPFFH